MNRCYTCKGVAFEIKQLFYIFNKTKKLVMIEAVSVFFYTDLQPGYGKINMNNLKKIILIRNMKKLHKTEIHFFKFYY